MAQPVVDPYWLDFARLYHLLPQARHTTTVSQDLHSTEEDRLYLLGLPRTDLDKPYLLSYFYIPRTLSLHADAQSLGPLDDQRALLESAYDQHRCSRHQPVDRCFVLGSSSKGYLEITDVSTEKACNLRHVLSRRIVGLSPFHSYSFANIQHQLLSSVHYEVLLFGETISEQRLHVLHHAIRLLYLYRDQLWLHCLLFTKYTKIFPDTETRKPFHELEYFHTYIHP